MLDKGKQGSRRVSQLHRINRSLQLLGIGFFHSCFEAKWYNGIDTAYCDWA